MIRIGGTKKHPLQFNDETTPITAGKFSLAWLCLTNTIMISFFLIVFPILWILDRLMRKGYKNDK
jgi:hypothetical protein